MDKKINNDKFFDHQSKRETFPLKTDYLRRMIQEGIVSGPGIDSDVVFTRLRKKYEDMARKDSG